MSPRTSEAVLVHLGAGIGNIVLATPLLIALHSLNLEIDLLLDADYPQTVDLFRDWNIVREVIPQPEAMRIAFHQYGYLVPAVPPFYWRRHARFYAPAAAALTRPPDALFYANEQAYYLEFARRLGYTKMPPPLVTLPITAGASEHATCSTVVLAPGSKTGEMAAKRWHGFATLADQFHDVALVGTPDDIDEASAERQFPRHVRSFIGRLTLRETVELMASASVVVGNDNGLSHAAAATGTPTVMLFGPTPYLSLGPFPPNVAIVHSGLPCEPCWTGHRFHACEGRIDCLKKLSLERVIDAIHSVTIVPTRRVADAASAHELASPGAITHTHIAVRERGPLVSCIMPTHNRRAFVPQALSVFLGQDYPHRELVVIDDGTESVLDLISDDSRIRYVRLDHRMRLGDKRNLGCAHAHGDLIAHWDDDDWMAPWRLSYQVGEMDNHPTAELCGLTTLFFYDPENDRAWKYSYSARRRGWVAGGTMCYRKAFWQRHRFASIEQGEDTRFAWSARPDQILALPKTDFYIARIHSHNSSRKRVTDQGWRTCPTDQLRRRTIEWGNPVTSSYT
jgi:ADP-heptose:LPS heptosyltransferase